MNNETINLPLTTKEAQMLIEYLNHGTVSPYTVNDTMLLINKVHAAAKPSVEPPPPASDQFVSKNGKEPKEAPEQKKSEEVEPSKKHED